MTRGTHSPAAIRMRSRITTARGRVRSAGTAEMDQPGVSRRAGGRALGVVVSMEAEGAGSGADNFRRDVDPIDRRCR